MTFSTMLKLFTLVRIILTLPDIQCYLLDFYDRMDTGIKECFGTKVAMKRPIIKVIQFNLFNLGISCLLYEINSTVSVVF